MQCRSHFFGKIPRHRESARPMGFLSGFVQCRVTKLKDIKKRNMYLKGGTIKSYKETLSNLVVLLHLIVPCGQNIFFFCFLKLLRKGRGVSIFPRLFIHSLIHQGVFIELTMLNKSLIVLRN